MRFMDAHSRHFRRPRSKRSLITAIENAYSVPAISSRMDFRRVHHEDPYEAIGGEDGQQHLQWKRRPEDTGSRGSWHSRQPRPTAAFLFAHWGCRGTIGASGLIKSSLEAAGLPTMILDGDGCNPANTSDGQASTGLQAYVEMLEEGKAEKAP